MFSTYCDGHAILVAGVSGADQGGVACRHVHAPLPRCSGGLLGACGVVRGSIAAWEAAIEHPTSCPGLPGELEAACWRLPQHPAGWVPFGPAAGLVVCRH
jgi:hypothetical protein